MSEHLPAAIDLDPSQRAVLDAAATGSIAVIGAPGTGKTTTLVELAAAAVDDGLAPEQIVAIAANRRRADELRGAIAERLGIAARGATLGRTAASIAMEVVGHERARAGLGRPRLLTGSEQDAVLADLIEGRLDDAAATPSRQAPLPWPASFDPTTMRLRGFRDELRQLFATMSELQVGPDDLARLGQAADDPAAERSRTLWPAAAELAREYGDVLGFAYDGAFDAPGVLGEAARVLESAAGGFSFAGSLADVRLVIVDDAQELTEAARRLLVAFERAGARIVTFGDPDLGTGDFHGGRSEFAVNWRDAGEPLPGRVLLEQVHRHGAALRDPIAAVSGRVGVRGEVRHRTAASAASAAGEAATSAVPTDADAVVPPIATATSPSETAENEVAVGYLRRLHLTAGIPLDEMAVIARSGARLPALAATFERAGMATSASTPVSAVADATVRALLDLARLAVDGEVASGLLARILTSPLYEIDPLEFRRLRRAAYLAEVRHCSDRSTQAGVSTPGGPDARTDDEAPTRTGAEVLADTVAAALRGERDAVGTPLIERLAAGPRPAAASAVVELGEVLRRMRARVDEHAPIDVVLFEAWRHPRRAEEWQRIALADGPGAAAMHRRLDAVVVLFDRAKRAVERSPGITLGGFLAEWQRDAVIDDSLAKRASRGAVTLTTPAGAVGREWRAVVLLGVNDGVWPNLRVRDTLLGANRLRELVDGVGERDGGAGALDRRAEVLSSETRLLVSAMSRARDHLLLSAQDGDETQPSPFLRWLAAPQLPPSFAIGAAAQLASGHITLSGLAAELRRALAGGAGDAAQRDGALRALARLADAGVSAADPGHWAGVHGRTTLRPLIDADPDGRIPMRLRPSGLQRFDECGVNWFVEDIAAAPPSSAQTFGTLIHLVAEREADFDDEAGMLDFAAREFEHLEFESPLERARTWRRVETAVNALWIYVRRPGLDRRISERKFEMLVDGGLGRRDGRELVAEVTVAGRIDRIEYVHHVVDGEDAIGARIVDFKTGTTVPKARDDERNAQLTCYQVAIRSGGVDGVDARTPIESSALVFLEKPSGRGRNRRDYTVSGESALNDVEVAEERRRLVRTALAQSGVDWDGDVESLMAPPVFHARPDVHCTQSHTHTTTCALHMTPEVTA